MSHERVVVWADDGGAFAAYLRSKQPPGRQARVQPCRDGYVGFRGFWVADSGDVGVGPVVLSACWCRPCRGLGWSVSRRGAALPLLGIDCGDAWMAGQQTKRARRELLR